MESYFEKCALLKSCGGPVGTLPLPPRAERCESVAADSKHWDSFPIIIHHVKPRSLYFLHFTCCLSVISGCLQTLWTTRGSAGVGSAGPDPALNSPLWFHFPSFLSSFSPPGLVLAPSWSSWTLSWLQSQCRSSSLWPPWCPRPHGTSLPPWPHPSAAPGALLTSRDMQSHNVP